MCFSLLIFPLGDFYKNEKQNTNSLSIVYVYGSKISIFKFNLYFVLLECTVQVPTNSGNVPLYWIGLLLNILDSVCICLEHT